MGTSAGEGGRDDSVHIFSGVKRWPVLFTILSSGRNTLFLFNPNPVLILNWNDIFCKFQGFDTVGVESQWVQNFVPVLKGVVPKCAI